MVKNMTEGKPLRLILMFFLPLVAGNLFQQFYNMADSIIVGQFLGVDALAGVGSTGSINFVVVGFVTGLGSGFSIPMAQAFGAGDKKRLRSCVANAVYLSAGAAVALTLITTLCARPILRIMQTPADIFSYAYDYIFIIFAGISASILYNFLSGILRALGDGRTPLYFLILSSAVNIGLDLLFILVFHTGVEGAAYATVIAQLLSGLFCLLFIMKKFPILRLSKEDSAVRPSLMRNLLAMGLPMALQFSITAVGTTILQAAVNTLGSAVVAAVAAASKVQMIITQPMEALGLTMATYCGQNLGAGRIERIKAGMHQAIVLSLIYSVVAFALLITIGTPMSQLFISGEETAIMSDISRYLWITGAFSPLLGFVFIYRNSLQGLGFAFPAMTAGICELAARAFVALAFVRSFGYFAVCFASPAAWVAADLMLLPFFYYQMKKLSKRFVFA